MENSHDYLGPALAAIVVPVVLGWLLRGVRTNARKDGTIYWLEYGKAMKGLALIFLAIVAAVSVAWFKVDPKDKNAVLTIVVLLGGLTLPLLLEFFFVRIGYDAQRIYCQSGWRKRRTVDWSEIDSAKFSPALQWWVIQTKTKGRIRAHLYLSGLRDFLSELKRRGVSIK